MAFRPHTLIAFGGALTERATDDEIWECTIRAISPGGSTLPLSDPAGYMGEISGPLATWFNDAKIASTSSLQWLKVNNIGANGRYSDSGTTNVHDYSPAVAGTGTAAAPSFCSIAYSWTTNRARPPGAFGRIYLPNFVTPCQYGGSAISLANASAHLARAIALLDLLRNCDGDLQALPVIASKVNATNTEINGARVGDIYDYQSRRKNADAETYEAQAWDSSCS